jgi:hypothetical protein
MASVGDKRALLYAETDTAELETRLSERPPVVIVTPLDRLLSIVRDNEVREIEETIKRRKRKRELFSEIMQDVVLSDKITDALEGRRDAKLRRVTSAASSVHAAMDVDKALASSGAATVVLRDVMLYHDGDTARHPNSTPLDEYCTNCKTTMARSTMSTLRCKKCGLLRAFVDSTTAASASTGAYSKHNTDENSMPKACLHYLTFLAAIQVKTTKRFDADYMRRLAYYVYVQGCRNREDITKELTNHAQRFEGDATKHNYSILYKQLLRGRIYRFPPELTLKLLLLFRKLWPEFLVKKNELRKDRSNMQAFKYVTRCFLRMLGYPVYLRCIEPFRMKETQLMHSSFARAIWKELGWVWEDGRVTEEWISDAMIDQYERLQVVKQREKLAKKLHEEEILKLRCA